MDGHQAESNKRQFVVGWDARFRYDKHAHLYLGNEESAAAFAAATNQVPKHFVRTWLEDSRSPAQYFRSAKSNEDLENAMLDFWADRTKQQLQSTGSARVPIEPSNSDSPQVIALAMGLENVT